MARIFLGRYDLSSYFGGVQNSMKIHGSAHVYVSQAHTSANKVQPNFNAFWKLLRLENSAWDSLRVNFWSRDFLEFCWKPYGFFWVLIFPPFDHPHHLKSGVPEYPLLRSPSPGTDTLSADTVSNSFMVMQIKHLVLLASSVWPSKSPRNEIE